MVKEDKDRKKRDKQYVARSPVPKELILEGYTKE